MEIFVDTLVFIYKSSSRGKQYIFTVQITEVQTFLVLMFHKPLCVVLGIIKIFPPPRNTKTSD